MRRTPLAVGLLAGLGLVVIASAFAASGLGDDTADLATTGTTTTATQQDSTAYPPTPPAVAATDEAVVVVHPAPDSTLSVQPVEAALSAARSIELPFDQPLVYPSVAAVDESTFYIAGVACATITGVDDLGPTCEPGGISVARYSALSDRVETLPVEGSDLSTPFVEIVGVSDGHLVVSLGDALYSLPSDGGELEALPEPPFDDGLTSSCIVGNTIVALSQSDGPGDSSPAPGEFVEEDYHPYVPFTVATMELGSEWVNAGGPDAEYDTNDTFEYGCTEQGLVAVPIERSTLQSAPHVTHIFDVERAEWSSAEPPPREFIAAAPVARYGSQLALSVSSDIEDRDTSLLVFHADTGTWTSKDGGAGSAVESMVMVDGMILTWSTSNGGLEAAIID